MLFFPTGCQKRKKYRGRRSQFTCYLFYLLGLWLWVNHLGLLNLFHHPQNKNVINLQDTNNKEYPRKLSVNCQVLLYKHLTSIINTCLHNVVAKCLRVWYLRPEFEVWLILTSCMRLSKYLTPLCLHLLFSKMGTAMKTSVTRIKWKNKRKTSRQCLAHTVRNTNTYLPLYAQTCLGFYILPHLTLTGISQDGSYLRLSNAESLRHSFWTQE